MHLEYTTRGYKTVTVQDQIDQSIILQLLVFYFFLPVGRVPKTDLS